MNRGSTRIRQRGRVRFGRFNEAPIHESGKSIMRYRALRKRVRASMRPRFMNRGSKDDYDDVVRADILLQ